MSNNVPSLSCDQKLWTCITPRKVFNSVTTGGSRRSFDNSLTCFARLGYVIQYRQIGGMNNTIRARITRPGIKISRYLIILLNNIKNFYKLSLPVTISDICLITSIVYSPISGPNQPISPGS